MIQAQKPLVMEEQEQNAEVEAAAYRLSHL